MIQSGSLRSAATQQNAGSILSDVNFDTIIITYPDAITEIAQYKIGGITGELSATLTTIFVDATKQQVNSVVKS